MSTFKSRKKVISPVKKCHKIPPPFHYTASLVVVVIQLFVLFPETYSQDGNWWKKKDCKQICDAKLVKNCRGKGSNFSYEFDCDTAYQDFYENKKCRDYCKSNCPDSICNDYAKYIFKCPSSNDYGKCRKLCDDNRPYDLPQNFSLTCKDEQDIPGSGFMTDNCTAVCLDCPDWICDYQVNDTLFYCPSKDFFKSDCKKDCDYQRERLYGPGFYFRKKFSFSCNDTDVDFQRCQDTCGLCPEDICDPYNDKIIWNCPALRDDETTPRTEGNGQKKCEKRCDKHRSSGIGSYELSCKRDFPGKKHLYKCFHECSRCSYICEIIRSQRNRYGNYDDDDDIDDGIFQCPPSVELGIIFVWIIAIFTIIFVAVIVLLVVGCLFWDMANKGVSVVVVNPLIPQQSASSIKNSASLSSTDVGATSSVADNEVPPFSPEQSGSAVNVVQPNS